jgi:hypothetical protein
MATTYFTAIDQFARKLSEREVRLPAWNEVFRQYCDVIRQAPNGKMNEFFISSNKNIH